MRSQQPPQKENIRHKINKKKRAKKSNSAWNFRIVTSNKNLENINEAFRIHKARSSSQGSWKLVPKDSCEVYKQRRKRQFESKHAKQQKDRDTSNPKGSHTPREAKDRDEKREKRVVRKKKGKRSRKGARYRSRSESSARSKESSVVTYTSMSTAASRTSMSDMEYE